jgi:hypothetical protein
VDTHLNAPTSRHQRIHELQDLIVNNRVLAEIQKGMFGLPQAGRPAYDRLVEHLVPHGYHPCARTPGLWKHETRPVTFCLGSLLGVETLVTGLPPRRSCFKQEVLPVCAVSMQHPRCMHITLMHGGRGYGRIICTYWGLRILLCNAGYSNN